MCTDRIQHLKDIFAKAVSSVRPQLLINKNVRVNESRLTIVETEIKLDKPCYVVGFGKAVYGMALALDRILNSKINHGILSVPWGTCQQMSQKLPDIRIGDLERFNRKFKCYEGARHNLPDNHSLSAANEIGKLCKSLTDEDLLIVLISGGGSALLPSLAPGITLDEKNRIIRLLFHRGGTINEINCIRSKLSLLKSGGLVRLAAPARVVSLILSDVVDDPLQVIASGPTIPTRYSKEQVDDILDKYQMRAELPQSILDILAKEHDFSSENDAMLQKNLNCIIGSNKIACAAAQEYAQHLGYKSVVLSTNMEGNVEEIAKCYEKMIRYLKSSDEFAELPQESLQLFKNNEIMNILKELKTSSQSICLICGGEPSIIVKDSNGKGGRNQHLALELSTLISDISQVYFLSCGTDGIDGPTDAAGAISPGHLSATEVATVKSYLSASDSYSFLADFQNGLFLVKTGHTGTNVMDVHILIIDF